MPLLVLLQVMAVTAVQDGQKSIHPAAISCFSAAENALTAETHTRAETLLNPGQNYDGHVCIVDGAPCLDAAATKCYEGITVTACRRHPPCTSYPVTGILLCF